MTTISDIERRFGLEPGPWWLAEIPCGVLSVVVDDDDTRWRVWLIIRSPLETKDLRSDLVAALEQSEVVEAQLRDLGVYDGAPTGRAPRAAAT